MAGEMLHFKHLPKLYRLFQKEEASFADHYRTEIAAKFVAVTTCSASGNKKKHAVEIQIQTEDVEVYWAMHWIQ